MRVEPPPPPHTHKDWVLAVAASGGLTQLIFNTVDRINWCAADSMNTVSWRSGFNVDTTEDSIHGVCHITASPWSRWLSLTMVPLVGPHHGPAGWASPWSRWLGLTMAPLVELHHGPAG